jgi:Spy/CpxP family protein refolding chaperone
MTMRSDRTKNGQERMARRAFHRVVGVPEAAMGLLSRHARRLSPCR